MNMNACMDWIMRVNTPEFEGNSESLEKSNEERELDTAPCYLSGSPTREPLVELQRIF